MNRETGADIAETVGSDRAAFQLTAIRVWPIKDGVADLKDEGRADVVSDADEGLCTARVESRGGTTWGGEPPHQNG